MKTKEFLLLVPRSEISMVSIIDVPSLMGMVHDEEAIIYSFLFSNILKYFISQDDFVQLIISIATSHN